MRRLLRADLGYSPRLLAYVLATVDRWAVPAWLPLGNVYSIGDVAIGIGVLLTIVIAMRPQLALRALRHASS